MLAPAGDPEPDAAAAVANYRSIIEYMGWQDKGIVLAGGVSDRDDIIGSPALLRAEELGGRL